MNRMNEDVKKKWVTALRSGDYEQGRRRLCRDHGNGLVQYCCLGVLAEVQGVPHQLVNDDTEYSFPNGSSSALGLSSEFAASVGLYSNALEVLVRMNDTVEAPFASIADYIETHL